MTRSRSYLSWGILGVFMLVVVLLSVGGPAGAAVDESGMPPTPPPDDSNRDPNSPCYRPESHGAAVVEIVHDIAPEAKL